MRIGLITPELPPYVRGGIGTYVQALARGFAERGHEVTVAGPQIHPEERIDHDWGRSFSYGPSLPVGWLRNKRRLFWRLSRLYPAANIAQAALATRNFLKKHGQDFDVVEISNWPGHGAFLPRIGCPYVTRMSSPGVACGLPTESMSTWYERRTCRAARLILAHSEAMLQEGQSLYGLGATPAKVIHLGLPDLASPGQPPPGDDLHVVYIGRAEDRKGTDLLIQALSRVMPRWPRLHLTLISRNLDRYCDERESLRASWRGLQATCSGRITLRADVDEAEKNRAIACSHWMIVPSRFESFGLVAVEAMRLGTPVLGARCGGLEEVCASGPGNLMFRPDDRGDLEMALEKICRLGSTHACALRAATRSAYEDRFRENLMIERTLAAYHTLLTPNGSRATAAMVEGPR